MPDVQPALDAVQAFADQAAAEAAQLRADLAEVQQVANNLLEDLEEERAAFAAHMATHEPDPDPDPEPGSLDERVKGTWVLQQVGSVQELDRLRGQILEAAAWPGIAGISIRFPWDACDITGNATSHPLLVAIKALGEEAGKPVSIRFMAGRHTPARVFSDGAASVVHNGDRAPVPWDNSSGRVQVFLDAYDEYVGKLAAWCRANGAPLLHGSWFALDWAELNHGKEIRAVEGYTEAKWLAGHKALISTLAQHRGADLAVELPMSGYGPLSGGQSAALVDHVISVVGPGSEQFFIQANGWGPNGEWGAPSQTVENDFDRIWPKAVLRGLQMIQPQDYDWSAVFARLDHPVSASYAEVYLPSFRLAHAQQLKAEIAAFAANPS